MQPIAGIFVGGRARRMGGRPKGNLAAPGGATVLSKLRATCEAAGARPVLVGGARAREAYAAEALPGIDDDPRAEGPLAGVVALLAAAGHGRAVALACDMPFVTADLLARLVGDPSPAAVVAARRGERWEPFFARYDAARVLPIALAAAQAGRLGLQALLDEAGAACFVCTNEEERLLDDWDEPADMEERRA